MHHFRYCICFPHFSQAVLQTSQSVSFRRGTMSSSAASFCKISQAALRTYKYNSVSFRRGTMWSFNFTSSSAASFCKNHKQLCEHANTILYAWGGGQCGLSISPAHLPQASAKFHKQLCEHANTILYPSGRGQCGLSISFPDIFWSNVISDLPCSSSREQLLAIRTVAMLNRSVAESPAQSPVKAWRRVVSWSSAECFSRTSAAMVLESI